MIPLGLCVRPAIVDGVGPWVWLKGDIFAWQEPLSDWPGIRDLACRHVRSRRCVIQAGGCLGLYPRLWSQHFEQVYTFEPDEMNFYCLSANCASERVIKFQAALGMKSGMHAFLPGPETNCGQGRIVEQKGRMPVVRIDDFVFDDIDFIQLDCEGGELDAIKGAMETIVRCGPAIMVETSDIRINDCLTSIGYASVGKTGCNHDRLFILR